MLLILDNYDSFTLNLVDYFEQMDIACIVKQNDVTLSELDQLSFQGIVLSPGPGTPSESGILMKVIEKYHQTHPILGICLGHQAIGQFFGADIMKAHAPVHGKTNNIQHSEDQIFNGIPQNFNVVRYHSLILGNLPNQIEKIAFDNSRGEIMAIRHNSLPIRGLQFHPESILTEYGMQILRNWVRLTGIN